MRGLRSGSRERATARGASGRGRRRRPATRRRAAARRAGARRGQGVVSWPATVRAARSTRRWLWAIRRRSVGSSASGAPGMPGNDVGCLGRPAATGRERGRERQAGTRVAGVADRLRHVPVGLATGQPQDRLRDGLDVVGERDGQRRRAAWRSTRPCRHRTAGGPPAGPSDRPVLDAPPGGDDVRSARFEGVDPRRRQGHEPSARTNGHTTSVSVSRLERPARTVRPRQDAAPTPPAAPDPRPPDRRTRMTADRWSVSRRAAIVVAGASVRTSTSTIAVRAARIARPAGRTRSRRRLRPRAGTA